MGSGAVGVRDVAGYLGLGRRRRPSLMFPGVDWAEQEQQATEAAQAARIAEVGPTPGPAATPEQRSWALEALRREMEGPQPSLPVRRGDWGGYEEGGVVHKPSLGRKVIGGIGQFLAAAGGGPGAGAEAHRQFFDQPFAESLGRASAVQAARERRIQDLLKVSGEEARLARAIRGDALGRRRRRAWGAVPSTGGSR